MQKSSSSSLPIILIVAAVVFAVLAALYAAGAVTLFASGAGHHYKHAAVLGVIAIACLVGASFLRQKKQGA